LEIETFQALPTKEVARLVRREGAQVCVFPINGTRRWFLLEHPPEPGEDWLPHYMDAAARNHVGLYRLFFDHGLDTLLTPIFGPDLLERGGDYMAVFADGLARLATHPVFCEFYDACQVRVRFYGDYRRFFAATPHAHLPDLFEEATERTKGYGRYRLFFGVCAHDPAETIARLSIAYHAGQGRVPDRRTLVALYYGELVEPVDLFIGFDRFSAFDMPLVATGREDLYFTVCPSPYMDEAQLRAILYDHLYTRRGGEPDYGSMGAGERAYMRAFYECNRGKTQGVGTRLGQVWYPLPQVELPGA
jgi:tuberculosinol/isotuberculosinol synthase